MAVFFAPDTAGGRAYLAPDAPPQQTIPPDDSDIPDAIDIPESRRVVFGGGTRVVVFDGGTRTVRF